MPKPDANEILLQLTAENKVLRKKLKESEEGVDKYTKRISKSSSNLSNGFRRMGAMITTYFGVRAIKSFINLAGQVDSVTGSFENLAKGAEGGADGLLKAMQVASKGTVDNLNIMRSSNLAFQLMGEQVAQHLPKMMEVAMAAAKAQGQDVASMFNDIVVASGRRSVLILDNLGISSATAAKYQEEFARTLGLTRNKLNDTQKSQAFFYAVMKAGGELIDKTGGSTLTLGERLQILEARFQNMGVQVSNTMIPALEQLLDSILDVDISGTSLFDRLIKGMAKFVNRMAYAIKLVRIWAGETNSSAEKAQENSERLMEQLSAQEEKVRSAYNADRRANDQRGRNWLHMVGLIRKATNEFESLSKMQEVVRSGAFSHEQVATARRYVEIMGQATEATGRASDLTESYANQLEKAKKEFLDTEKAIEEGKKRDISSFVPKPDTTVDEEARQRRLKATIAYYEYIDQFRKADLLKEEAAHEEMLKLQLDFEKDKSAISEAFQKKQLLADQNAHKKRIKYDEAVLRAKLKFDSIEYQSSKELFANSSTLMQSKNKFLFKLGKGLAYASAVMSAAEGIAKVWSVWGAYPPVAAAFSAIVAAATGVQIDAINRTKLPNYKKGRMPVLADGYVPADHFPALIGSKEAVINERSTLANLDILKAMNDRPGETVSSGSSVKQEFNFSGNVMTEEFILERVLPEFEKQARYEGKELFSEKI